MEEKKKSYLLPIILISGIVAITFALLIAGVINQKKAVEIKKESVVTQTPVAAKEPVVQKIAPAAEPATAVALVPVAEPVPAVTSVPAAVSAPAEPKVAKDFYQRGEDFYYKGKFDDAIADFKKATELDLKYADAYCEMGVSYMEKSDWDTAIATFNKCLQIDSNHPKANYAVAVSYARKPQPDVKVAREYFEKAKKLGFMYPQWFEDFLKRLEAGQQLPAQTGAAKQ